MLEVKYVPEIYWKGGTQARPSFPGSDLERGGIHEPQTAKVHLEHSIIYVPVSFVFSLCPVRLR